MMMYHSLLRTEENSFQDFTQGLSKYQDWFCHPRASDCLTHKDALEDSMKNVAVDLRVNTWPRSVRLDIN